VAAAVLFGQSCPRRYDWTDSTSRYGLALRCTVRVCVGLQEGVVGAAYF
jgi:hypothetical protein